MATLMTITSEDAKHLQKRLTVRNKELLKYIATEWEELGRLSVIALQNETPKDEGVLSNSTRWGIYGRGTKQQELRIMQGNELRPKLLPVWLTFGTRRGMKPNPYIKRAWAKTANERKRVAARVGGLLAKFLTDPR